MTRATDFWLGPDRLPLDIQDHLKVAYDARDPRADEVAGLLDDLASLVASPSNPDGLSKAEARAAIRSAAQYVLDHWIEQQAMGRNLSAEDAARIDIAEMPTRQFMAGMVTALARQVRWKRGDLKATSAIGSDWSGRK